MTKFNANKIIPSNPVICPKLVIVELKSENRKDIGSKKAHLAIGIKLKTAKTIIGKYFLKLIFIFAIILQKPA